MANHLKALSRCGFAGSALAEKGYDYIITKLRDYNRFGELELREKTAMLLEEALKEAHLHPEQLEAYDRASNRENRELFNHHARMKGHPYVER